MKTYTTYHKIIDLLKQAQQQSPRMNSFGQGDIVYFADSMSGNTIQYPLMFATPLAMTYDENTTTYQMSIIFADIVHTDLSNEIDVVSDMELEARSLLSQIKRGFLQDDIDITLPATSTPFFERFNDHVGGVVLDVALIVFEDINACEPYPPCPDVTQYLEVQLSDSNKFKLALWGESSFSLPVEALCDYVIEGIAYGSMGTVYQGTETITTGQHIHLFNLASVLQSGEVVTSFEVLDYTLDGCRCLINLVLPE
jgi:hypothetical protein